MNFFRFNRGSFGSFQNRPHREFKRSMSQPENVSSWLSSLGYEFYIPLFINAGYDLATVSKMTPEDMTAVGVQLPQHRHKLMTAVTKLQQLQDDGLPDFIPDTLGEWLHLIRLESHENALLAQV